MYVGISLSAVGTSTIGASLRGALNKDFSKVDPRLVKLFEATKKKYR